MNGHNNIIYEHSDGTINAIIDSIGIDTASIDSRYETYNEIENVNVFTFNFNLKNGEILTYRLYVSPNGLINNELLYNRG